MSAENLLIWLERDPRLFKTALCWVDLSQLLMRSNVLPVVGYSSREVHDLLLPLTQRILSAKIQLSSHPSSQQNWPNSYRELRQAVQNFTQEAAVRVRTALFLSRFTLRNCSGNLGNYIKSPGIKFLRGALKGEPAILVSAGPSLQKNVSLLREAMGKIAIIAVSTTLRPLLEQGIRPDFTCLIDYHRISKRYFEDIDPAHAPPMVVDMRAAREAVDIYPGEKLFANDHVYNTVIDSAVGDMGDLPPGSTVAHSAFQFLQYLGADPIILIGQDLSYPGGLIHLPGTSIQKQEYPNSQRFYTLEMRELEYYYHYRDKFQRVPGNLGGSVPTDEIMYSYITEFERMFKGSKTRIINATEGGAKLRGTQIMTFRDVLYEFRNHQRPQLTRLIQSEKSGYCEEKRRQETMEVIQKRGEELQHLQEVYSDILKLLNEIIVENENGYAADQKVNRVQELHGKARKLGKTYLVLSQLAQADGWRRLQDDRSLDAQNLTGVEKQLFQSKRDHRFVTGLYEAGLFMKECYDLAEKSLISDKNHMNH